MGENSLKLDIDVPKQMHVAYESGEMQQRVDLNNRFVLSVAKIDNSEGFGNIRRDFLLGLDHGLIHESKRFKLI